MEDWEVELLNLKRPTIREVIYKHIEEHNIICYRGFCNWCWENRLDWFYFMIDHNTEFSNVCSRQRNKTRYAKG